MCYSPSTGESKSEHVVLTIGWGCDFSIEIMRN